MNRALYERFSSVQLNKLQASQIATIDYLLKVVLDDNESVLVYHLMGTGKTILAIIFALIASKTNNVYIVLPSSIIRDNWYKQVSIAFSKITQIGETLEQITFTTTTVFEKMVLPKNSIVIVDEAHKIFSKQHYYTLDVRYVLLTGTPFVNTVGSLKNIVQLLVPGTQITIKDSKLVYKVEVSDTAIREIVDNEKIHISYYELDDAPMHRYNGTRFLSTRIIFCPMSPLQLEEYDSTLQSLDKENTHIMFSKDMNNVSFCAVGNSSMDTSKGFAHGLSFSDILHGEELERLDISSKLKYIVPFLKDVSGNRKHFVYFENSSYGTVVLSSVFARIGFVNHNSTKRAFFFCRVHGVFEKKPREPLCRPVVYAIITHSIKNTKEENLLGTIDDYNRGEIDILCGSKIISEAYTLVDTKHIWFLTIPSSPSEMDQIVARAVRRFAQTRPFEIEINILVASKQSDRVPVDIADALEYLESDDQFDISFDVRKMLYVELKRANIEYVHEHIFRQIGKLDCGPHVHPMLFPLVLYYESLIYISNGFEWNPGFIVTEEDLLAYCSEKDILYNKKIYRFRDGKWEAVPYLFRLPKYVIHNEL